MIIDHGRVDRRRARPTSSRAGPAATSSRSTPRRRDRPRRRRRGARPRRPRPSRAIDERHPPRHASRVDGGADELAAVAASLDDAGIAIDDIGLRRPTLDEVFLALTGQPIDTAAPTRAAA